MTRFMPLVIFMALSALLYAGLFIEDKDDLDSTRIDKIAPPFNLSQLHNTQKSFVPMDMAGKVWLLNVWASWCVACRSEHPLLMEMSRRGDINIVGLNYKDRPENAKQWLSQHGNPYMLSAVDFKGDVGIEYGVYGVPETFVIDKDGIVRYKVIGPITREKFTQKLLPKINELQQSPKSENKRA